MTNQDLIQLLSLAISTGNIIFLWRSGPSFEINNVVMTETGEEVISWLLFMREGGDYEVQK